MDSKIYYFKTPFNLPQFLRNQQNQPIGGQLEHDATYSFMWATCAHDTIDVSQLTLGKEKPAKIEAPDVSIIYGELVEIPSEHYHPMHFVSEVQPKHVVSAVARFAPDLLHLGDSIALKAIKAGVMDYTNALAEAQKRYTELRTLALAVDKTSEACRQQFELSDPKTVALLRDIYTAEGACTLQTKDLMATLLTNITQYMVRNLPLEFTMHIPEFQHKAQENYMNYAIKVSAQPVATEQKCLDCIRSALDWLGDIVKDEDMCHSAEAWEYFEKTRNEVAALKEKVNAEPCKYPSIVLVEHRHLEDPVNVSSMQRPLPTFTTYPEAQQYMQKQTARYAQVDPTNTGYFMIYRANTANVESIMKTERVALCSTEVYMLGNGIFDTKTYTLSTAIQEQELRTKTWDNIKRFARDHSLDATEMLRKPWEECEIIRNAFAPGALLHTGCVVYEPKGETPEAVAHQPIFNIQRMLCNDKGATFDTVYAAIMAEQAYNKTLQCELESGKEHEEAIRTSITAALENAYKCMQQSETSVLKLEQILEQCIQYAASGESITEYLEWYANVGFDEPDVTDK